MTSTTRVDGASEPDLDADTRADADTPATDATTDEPTPAAPKVSLWRLAALLGFFGLLGVWQGGAILIVIAALLIIIFLHELGHFVMARRAGMKVTEFFIGFGPRIWSFRRGEVEYGMKALPLGAYVKVVGMTSADEVPSADEPRTYRQAGFWPRIGVAVAGSTMHFILALVIFFSVFLAAGRPSEALWTASDISTGSAAEASGLRLGDRVVAVDGVAVNSFDEMGDEVRLRPGRTVPLLVERDGEEITLTAQLGGRSSIIGTVGEDLAFGAYDGRVRIHSVNPGSRTTAAGLRDNDLITAVNGVTLTSLEALPGIVDEIDGGTVRITVERPGAAGLVSSEHAVDLGTAVDTTRPEGFLGVGPEEGREDLGVVGAAGAAVSSFGRLGWQAISSIAVIFNPVNIVEFAGTVFRGEPDPESQVDQPTSAEATGAKYVRDNSARPSSLLGIIDIGAGFTDDWPTFFAFLGAVNVMIGVLNLIPLLPFDGGHVAVACYERIRELRRRDGRRYLVDTARLMPIVYGVVAVLGTVALLAVVADITQPLQI